MARAKPGQTPWAGTDANERQYNGVRNALVGIILDGVTGVSPELPGHSWRQVPPEKADQWIEKGRQVLANFESQACAPGGARGKAQKWMDRTIDELRRLMADAEAVRSGKRPQKQTPESYDELRKSLGVHEAGRRRVAPRPPEPVTPPSHSAPPRSFKSAGGRTFTLGAPENLAPKQGQSWEILYNGEDAGKLWCDENYGPTKPWHASTRGLFWKYASDAPTGIGFDVAAFATAEQALNAWGRSADQILDWSEGKTVHTGYGHGPAQRPGGARTVRAASHHVSDFDTLSALVDHAHQELGATHSSGTEAHTKLYFPRGGQHPYEEATVWRKAGYWHAQGPGSRTGVAGLPAGAKPLGRQGQRAAEPRTVRDYIAVDRHDRTIGGPFKDYDRAKQAAGGSGVVQFVPSGSTVKPRPAGAREERSAHHHIPRTTDTLRPRRPR